MSRDGGGATVLFDAPGPRARARNRVIGAVAVIGVAALLAYIVARFAATGQFSAKKWSILEYEAVQRTLLDGYLFTLKAAAMAGVFAVVTGALLAVARRSDLVVVRGVAYAVVELFRAIPLLLLMFLFYYGLPQLGVRMSPFWAVVLALTLYNGAVLAEVFRAGIDAVPRGQREAALSLGLSRRQTMSLVLLPQAIRTMLPAIISQLVVLLKDTALGFLVTYDELLKQIKQLAASPEFEFPLIPLVIVGGSIYIATCLALSFFATWLEGRMRRSSPAPTTTAPSGRARPLVPLAPAAAGE